MGCTPTKGPAATSILLNWRGGKRKKGSDESQFSPGSALWLPSMLGNARNHLRHSPGGHVVALWG